MAPRQKPGKSVQAVATPTNLLYAIRRKLDFQDGEDFVIDLAADNTNTVVPNYYDEAANSLIQDWGQWTGWCWLNPPFGNIAPWVKKAGLESDNNTRIAVLVPASVGANWWRNHVHGRCEVHFLNGRPTFVGHMDPYPKDLALLLYGPYHRGYYIWTWSEELD